MNNMDSQPSKPDSGAKASSPVIAWMRGLAGAVGGGLLGFLLFKFLLGYGLYAGIIPGAFVGIGFSIAAQRADLFAGLVCGVVGLVFGFWCDAATNLPPENLVGYFQTIEQVPFANIVMIVLGGFAAFWFGRGHRG